MRAFLLLFLVGCTHDIEAYRPSDVKSARNLDVLFVLDDSADRASYAAMESQLDVLQTRLAETDGQLPSLHVGVVTTDLGVSGTLDTVPGPAVDGCSGDGKGGKLQRFASSASADYLEDLRGADGTRTRNYSSDDLTLELGELTNPAAAGAGCEYEQPLEAMRRALDPATNPGFIRPDAMLSIVFLTNEDDCSLSRGAMLDPSDGTLGPSSDYRCTAQGVVCDPDEPGTEGKKFNCRPREGSQFMVDVSEYEAFLNGYKPDRKDISVAAVAGPRSKFVVRNIGGPTLQPSCQGTSGSALPAVRIGALVDSFGGAMIDSCTQEGAYQQIAAPIVERQRTCFPSMTAASEPDCTVVEVAGDTELELDRCTTGDAGPCWYSYTDAAACPSGGNIGVAIKRGTTSAPEGSRLEARCFVR